MVAQQRGLQEQGWERLQDPEELQHHSQVHEAAESTDAGHADSCTLATGLSGFKDSCIGFSQGLCLVCTCRDACYCPVALLNRDQPTMFGTGHCMGVCTAG